MGGRDIAIVGGGPAGLAAAWRLAGAGAAVTLYERRETPGGRMRTDTLDGVRLDPAVQLLGSYYTETFRLAREAGAADLLVRSPGRDALWRGGRAHPLTYGSVPSMTLSGALPMGLKLRLGTRYVSFLQRHAAELDANAPARAAAAGLDRESIAAWGRREMGADFVELLVYPLLAAYYGAVPEDASAGFYHGLARAGMDVSLHAVRGGVGELPAALLRALERRGTRFRGGVAVEGVEVAPDGVRVRTPEGDVTHDALVLALPPRAAAALDGLPEPAARWLEGVHTAPAVSLALVLEGETPVDWFGLSFPRTEPPGETLVAACVEERKGAGLVPRGSGVIVAFPAPALAATLSDAEPQAALERMRPALERAFPGIGGRIRRAKLYRMADAVTFYPGYLERLRAFVPSILPERLALAGDYLVAPTVEGAVRSGLAAADRVLAVPPASGRP